MKNKLQPESSPNWRRIVIFCHLWLGLTVGIYFSVVGCTGSVLVFQDNLESVAMPELRYCAPLENGMRLISLTRILQRARFELPTATDTDLAHITMPVSNGGAYRLQLESGQPDSTFVTLDPYDGHIIRDVPYLRTFYGWIHDLHVNLLLGAYGLLANGYGGSLAVLLLLSGLWLWWPSNGSQLVTRFRVKRKAGTARLLLDLHRAFGIYSLLLLLLVALTGTLFVFPGPVRAVQSRLGSHGRKAIPVVPVPRTGTTRLSIEQLLAIAEPISPNVAISSISYPTKLTEPFSCYKRSFAPGLYPYVRIFIDPYSGRVLKISDDRNAPPAAKLQRVLAMLHFGLWGGLLVKTLYAAIGLMPLGLFVTGVCIYLRKRHAYQQHSAKTKVSAQ